MKNYNHQVIAAYLIASNGPSTYKYLYNNSDSSYFFIGVRIIAGNIIYFSFNFSANRDYYNVSDYLQQHMCQIFDTSNCNNLEVPFSQTCVMLNAVFDPDNDLSQFFKLTLVGTKQRLMLIFVVVLSFMALLVLITFIILPGFICTILYKKLTFFLVMIIYYTGMYLKLLISLYRFVQKSFMYVVLFL